MLSRCINKHVYQGLHNKHLANRRHRTDDEKASWKVKAAKRKAQRAKARKHGSSEEESSEAESSEAESSEAESSEAESSESGSSDDGKSKKKEKRVTRSAAVRSLDRPDAESSGGGKSKKKKKGKRVARSAPVRSLDRPDAESRASDLLENVLGGGGGGLLSFIETVSWSIFRSELTKLNVLSSLRRPSKLLSSLVRAGTSWTRPLTGWRKWAKSSWSGSTRADPATFI